LPLSNFSVRLESNGVAQVSKLIERTTLVLVGTSSRVKAVTGVVIVRTGLELVSNRHERGVFESDDDLCSLVSGRWPNALGVTHFEGLLSHLA
jgi:hypothetical protein